MDESTTQGTSRAADELLAGIMSTHFQHFHERALRVLVVDDHELFRSGLRELLEDEGFRADDVESGEPALRRLATVVPDVVVMDPGMSGVDATRRLRDAAPAAGVLVLTLSEDEDQVLEAIRAGASGYLLKDAPLEEITAAIRAVAAGCSPLAPRVARVVIDAIRRARTPKAPTSRTPQHALSERERQVLALLSEGRDNAEIGRRLFVSTSTVKNDVSRLLEKLELDNRVQAATYAIRHAISTSETLAT